jgi:hypothetical protein
MLALSSSFAIGRKIAERYRMQLDLSNQCIAEGTRYDLAAAGGGGTQLRWKNQNTTFEVGNTSATKTGGAVQMHLWRERALGRVLQQVTSEEGNSGPEVSWLHCWRCVRK